MLPRTTQSTLFPYTTLFRSEECTLATRAVVGIGMGATEEHSVLNADRGKVAAAHAEEREGSIRLGLRDLSGLAVRDGRPPQAKARREEEALPRVGGHRVVEKALALAAHP